MKIVMHLLSTHIFSGAENVACQIINTFKEKDDYKMYYASEINENKENLIDRKIEYCNLEKFNYKNVKKIVNKIKPDIIHAHDAKASVIASCFSKQAKIISHIHGNHENMRKITLKSLLFNLVSRKFDKIVWVSQTALDNYYFKDNIMDKSIVLYNVIDSKEIEEKIQEDKETYNYDIIFLGRITYPKNPKRLIKILNEVCKKNKSIKIAIVGTGDLEQEIKQEIRNLKLEDNIDLLGFKSNPYKILKSSKIMVMTSIYEGTPMCALEAIACGLPIVTTITDGLKEIVIDGETGYLSNDDDTLVEKINLLINDKETYKKMHEKVNKYNLEINDIKKYRYEIEKIYES